ncbi:transposable element Tcb1 transposase [Trichonephila clavipes]|nr:transposable element Tcb1 transposase [Trichonephila clavipes]
MRSCQEFERGRIIGMMEAVWSAQRVARQHLHYGPLGLSKPLQVTWLKDSGITAPITCGANATHQRLHLEWCHAQRDLTATEWNQVVFSEESGFNLSSDDNRVCVWRPRGEHLNSAFALQRHTAPPGGVTIWGAMNYYTLSSLILIKVTLTVQRYVHDILQLRVTIHGRVPRSPFSTRKCLTTHSKDVTRLPPPHYHPSLACSMSRFVTNRA